MKKDSWTVVAQRDGRELRIENIFGEVTKLDNLLCVCIDQFETVYVNMSNYDRITVIFIPSQNESIQEG